MFHEQVKNFIINTVSSLDEYLPTYFPYGNLFIWHNGASLP